MRDDRSTHDETTMSARERGGTAAGLARLEDLDDYKVSDGYPDPRGWDVTSRDGRTIGEVKNLLVDRQAMRVRFLEVALADDLDGAVRKSHVTGRERDDRFVHVPVERARLDDDHDTVRVDLDAAAITGLGRADLTRTPAAASPQDQQRFFGRRAATADAPYLVLHEERLAIGKRQTQAGEVQLHKTVETEHVEQRVPVTREEVTVERRAVSPEQARAMGDRAQIGEDEIRVPVMREEVVAEKRVVPTEEVIVRKSARTEEQTIDETVRKERMVVDRTDRPQDRRPDARDR